jgi:nucleotide-binding universal stress UspA family protein
MRTFTKILVPVDLSSRGEQAIRMALDLLDRERGVVWLLHVVETIVAEDDAELESFYADLGAKAASKLTTWIADLGVGQVRIEPLITFGHRAREILQRAESLGCDLVVLSSHRVDPDHPAGGIGTISHQVALLCGCPVLLVR